MPFMMVFNPIKFASEIAFTIIAVIFCFMIYFKTKKIYSLTRYDGISYFRMAFLFFGISYLLRFILGLLFFSTFIFSSTQANFFIPRQFMLLFILPLSYLSTMGIFYLIYANIWKKFDGKLYSRYIIMAGHIVALVLCIVSIITRSPMTISLAQFLLLMIAILLGVIAEKNSKKITTTKVLYFLVVFLWLINLLIIDNRRAFPLWIDILFEIVSIGIFIAIYHKISKWVK